MSEPKRYSLSHPSSPSDEDFTILHGKRFSMKRLERQGGMKATLWNVSPPKWPGSTGAKLKAEKLAKLVTRAYDHSQDRAHLVLWIPAQELHQTELNPLEDIKYWLPMANILSGNGAGMHVGFVYAKGPSIADWDSKVLFDERGRRGAASSHSMRFILERLTSRTLSHWVYDGSRVIDMFVHSSGQLALWSRRLGIKYVGYTSSSRTFEGVKEKLAQAELPGIQVALPAT